MKAGFETTLEDEDDVSTSHCEFNATHTASAKKYSVEAKSRHRRGYLGQAGEPQPLAEIKAQVKTLLEKALGKRAPYERIIFLDVNVPPEHDRLFETQWFQKVFRDVNELISKQSMGKQYPPAYLIFTNHGEHYIKDDSPAPLNSVLFTAINRPDFQTHDPRFAQRYPAILDLVRSLRRHAKIPNEFL